MNIEQTISIKKAKCFNCNKKATKIILCSNNYKMLKICDVCEKNKFKKPYKSNTTLEDLNLKYGTEVIIKINSKNIKAKFRAREKIVTMGEKQNFCHHTRYYFVDSNGEKLMFMGNSKAYIKNVMMSQK